jgi:hypothetical protein
LELNDLEDELVDKSELEDSDDSDLEVDDEELLLLVCELDEVSLVPVDGELLEDGVLDDSDSELLDEEEPSSTISLENSIQPTKLAVSVLFSGKSVAELSPR